MKHHLIRIIAVAFSFCFITGTSAQDGPKFYIGLRSGVASDITLTPQENVRYTTGTHASFYTAPFELNFSADFSERFGMMLGVAYKEYEPLWKHSIIGSQTTHQDYPKDLYFKSVQIPLRLFCNYPLRQSPWTLFVSMGAVLDIPVRNFNELNIQFLPQDTFEYTERYWLDGDEYWVRHDCETYYRKIPFNVLLETGIGCSYTLGQNWKFYATATYDMGFRIVSETSVDYTIFSLPTRTKEYFTDRVLYKGDYWMLALGVNCRLNRK